MRAKLTSLTLTTLSRRQKILIDRMLLGVIAAWLLAEAQGQPVAEAPFTRITNGVIGAELAMSVPAAWGDYDNDGWLDLFVGNWHTNNWLFRNNQDGTFTKVTSSAVSGSASALPFSAAWADYDNDGWCDLIVANHEGTALHAVYRNSGSGEFAKMSLSAIGPLASAVSRAHTVTLSDYDSDGWLDVFIGNGTAESNARDFLFHNDGSGQFQEMTNNPIVAGVLSSTQGTWADFDNDGDQDLFVTHILNQGNLLFRNDGAGQWREVAATSGLGEIGFSVGAAWGDYDNDGDLDLFVTNGRLDALVTPNFFYRNQGDGTFSRITTGALASDQDHFVSCAWVDYDNDGWLDLFLTVMGHNSPDPHNRLYRNQGDGTFVRLTQGHLVTDSGNFGAGAWGDYDNDGFPDVFVTLGTIYSPQRSALYHNNGNANNWIKIRCIGTISNRSAIGTKIRVKARIAGVERWQMRQIAGSEGWVTFNSLEALFGLGGAPVVEIVRVEWPSGIVQELHNIPARQTLTIVERTDFSIANLGGGAFELRLKGPRQQRYRLESSSDLTNWSFVDSLTITNADGSASFLHTHAGDEFQMFFRVTPQ